MSQLKSVWTKHLKGEDKENFEKLLRNSTTVLSRLRDILKERDAEIRRAELSVEDFSLVGWDYRAAFRTGQKSALAEIESLLQFIENR